MAWPGSYKVFAASNLVLYISDVNNYTTRHVQYTQCTQIPNKHILSFTLK